MGTFCWEKRRSTTHPRLILRAAPQVKSGWVGGVTPEPQGFLHLPARGNTNLNFKGDKRNKGNTSHSQVKWLNNPHYKKETGNFCMERISLVRFKRKMWYVPCEQRDCGMLCMESQGRTHFHHFSLSIFLTSSLASTN